MVIGHTVTDEKDTAKLLRNIQKNQMSPKGETKGWADIGYHFLLDDRDCFKCRKLNIVPALLCGPNKAPAPSV